MGLKQIYNFIARLNKKDTPYTVVDEHIMLVDGKWEGFLEHDNVIGKTIEIYTLPNKSGDKVLNYTIDRKEESWKSYLKVFSQSDILYVTYETYGDMVEAEDINKLQSAAYYLEDYVEKVEDKVDIHNKDSVRHITGNERGSWNSRAFQKDLDSTNSKVSGLESSINDTNVKLEQVRRDGNEHHNDPLNPHGVNKYQVGLGSVDNVQQATKEEFDSHKNNIFNPHSVTKSQVGLGSVDNVQQATKAEFNQHVDDIISHLTTEERIKWGDKYTRNEIDNKFSSLESNMDWKEAVETFEDIVYTYSVPQDGWTVNVKDTDYTYRYNGTEWVAISANAIPKATSSLDGLMSHIDKLNLDDTNSKKHTHGNKSIIDAITQVLINNWNSAVTHISDAVKHITSTERTLWNTVSSKVDKVAGKGLSTEDYTTDEKSKLAGVANNANNYSHPNSDGNKHVPATGTTNNGRVLKAGTTAGAMSWGNITPSEIGAAPTSHGTHVTYGTVTSILTSGGVGVVGTSAKLAREDHTHTMPSYPTSLPANGGNSDTVDGKHASEFATSGHTHDDRYYTETEVNNKFVTKDDLGIAGYGDMTKSVYDTNNNGTVDKADAVPWTGVTGKPSTYPPTLHNHDSSYAASSHNHDSAYATKTHNHDSNYSGRNLKAGIYTQITVEGDANKYYPVIINDGGPSFGPCLISVSRGYNWTAPSTWNTSTHRGGLTLGILWNGDTYWGGNSGSSYIVTMFDQTYTTVVGGLSLSTSGLVVWLRGGGALYQIDSDFGMATTVNIQLSGFTDSAGTEFPVRSNVNNVSSEIDTRYAFRSGGKLYDTGIRVYSPNNKPTPSDIGALPKTGLTWNDLKGV